MSKIEKELIIDIKNDKKGDDILFIHPDYIKGTKFCASNTFDLATINSCATEKLSSGNLIGIYNSLKPGAEISITVFQPIAIMLPYDSKQIEANLQLVGFENINTREESVPTKKGLPHTSNVIVSATKPIGKNKIEEKQEPEKQEKKYFSEKNVSLKNKLYEEKIPKKIIFRIERNNFSIRTRVNRNERKRMRKCREVNVQILGLTKN